MGRPKGSKNKPKNVVRTLAEVAQELVTYVNTVSETSNVGLELTLPRSVIVAYNTATGASSMLEAPYTVSPDSVTLNLTGGTVTLTSTESTASEQVA